MRSDWRTNGFRVAETWNSGVCFLEMNVWKKCSWTQKKRAPAHCSLSCNLYLFLHFYICNLQQQLPSAPYTPVSPSYKINTPVPSSSCRETSTTSPWIQFCRHSNNTWAVLPERRGPRTLRMLTLRKHTSPLLSPLWAGQIPTWFTSNPAMCLWWRGHLRPQELWGGGPRRLMKHCRPALK